MFRCSLLVFLILLLLYHTKDKLPSGNPPPLKLENQIVYLSEARSFFFVENSRVFLTDRFFFALTLSSISFRKLGNLTISVFCLLKTYFSDQVGMEHPVVQAASQGLRWRGALGDFSPLLWNWGVQKREHKEKKTIRY